MLRALGTSVLSGMLGVTFFGLFLTPVFYVVIRWFVERRRREAGTLIETTSARLATIALVPCLLGLLSGCMPVGPDYKTPPTQMPEAFANQTQAGLSTETVETLVVAWLQRRPAESAGRAGAGQQSRPAGGHGSAP